MVGINVSGPVNAVVNPGGTIGSIMFNNNGGGTGNKWGAGGAATPVTVTYSFPGIGSAWSEEEDQYSRTRLADAQPFVGFVPLNEVQKANFRKALAAWSRVSGITFQEVPDTATDVGDIRVAFTQMASSGDGSITAGFAYGPSSSPSGGDIWLNNLDKDKSFEPGTDEFQTMTHEIGHAIGLKHPFPDNTPPLPQDSPVLPTSQNDYTYTIMSYTARAGMTGDYDYYPTSAMRYDIETAQYLYGVGTATLGDDTYTIASNGKSFQTIFDGGGNDTIDLTGNIGATLSLTPGTWSRIGVLLFGDNKIPVDNLFLTRTTIIENANGTLGNDTIGGNSAANVIRGRAGNDRITGGNGDRLFGDTGDDVIDTTEGGSLFVDGGEGSDTLAVAAQRNQLVSLRQESQTGDYNLKTRIGGVDGTVTFRSIETIALGARRLTLTELATELAPPTPKPTPMPPVVTPSAPPAGAPPIVYISQNVRQAEGTGIYTDATNEGATGYRYTLTRVGDVSAASTVTLTLAGYGQSAQNPMFLKQLTSNLRINGAGNNVNTPIQIYQAAASGTPAPPDQNLASWSRQLTFAPGEKTVTVDVYAVPDSLPEPIDSFSLKLSNPVGATLGRTTATGTLLNDDYEGRPETDLQVDLGGPGTADLLLRQSDGGILTNSLDGLDRVSTTNFGNPSNDWQVRSVAYDINGDGSSDVLWRSKAGEYSLWLMDGGDIGQSSVLGNWGGVWDVALVGDFDGDGQQDLLWRSTSNEYNIWLMDGATYKSSAYLGKLGQWKATATPDLNKDGKADILWAASTGEVAAWTMDGTKFTNSQYLGVFAGWTPVATPDLDGDGRDDMLMRNAQGQIGGWLTPKALTAPATAQVIGSYDPGWNIAGVADFNGDGKSDVLLRHNDGGNALFLMDGLKVALSSWLGNFGSDIRVASSPDIDGDRAADLVWRDARTGAVGVWLMDGNNYGAYGGVDVFGTGTTPIAQTSLMTGEVLRS